MQKSADAEKAKISEIKKVDKTKRCDKLIFVQKSADAEKRILEIERLDKTRRCDKLIPVATRSRQTLKKARSQK